MARHARVSLAAGDTKTALLAALETPPAGGSSIRCYGTSTGLSRPLPKESPAYYDGEALSAQRPGRGAGGVLSMAWKAAAGVGVLVLAATLIRSAASKMGSTFEEAVNLTEKRAGSPAETIQALTIQASNEYGVFNKAALDLYGLEMIIEPYRETTLTVKGLDSSIRSKRFVWRLQHASKHGVTSETPGDAWSHTGGPQAVVTADRPGTLYQVTVQAIDGEGGVIAEGKAKASCKYVRREIRDLTEADREAFFNAMQVWYTVPNEVGQARYGSDFSNYQRITAYHNTDAENFCYHQGMQFLTSHVTFMFVVERYLQMIDPRVSLPIWDYMIEALTLGDEWYNSVIFSPDWFGDAMGKEENSFMVSEGRFGNVSTIYDPDHTLVDDRIVPSYNPYGYMTSVSNYQDLPRLTRTSSYCGLSSKATFATPEVFVACFEDYNTFYDWEQCMQLQIHGDLHGMLGGAFNCNTDMKQFAQDHPEYSHSLLAFTLQQVTFKYGACNALTPNDNACDTECEKGQTEPCGCTCLIDAFSISDEQVYAYMEDFMETATLDFTGDVFISYDEGAQFPYGFMQGGERMSHEETFFLMRTLVKIGCEPGAVGQMATAAAPNDPIFHVLHPIFEKALHILLLSPKYRDTYTFEWIDGSCPGSGYKEELPFTEKLLGIGTGTAFLTNERLLELMDPTNPEMPYVFTDFSRWGNTETDLI